MESEPQNWRAAWLLEPHDTLEQQLEVRQHKPEDFKQQSIRISSQVSMLSAATNCSDKIFNMWKGASVARK